MGSRQLGLFGELDDPVVGPASVDPALQGIAGALPEQLRMGTSSWSFPGWKGLVWDREAKQAALSRHGLKAYAQHPLLRSVGVDRTFYGPVPASELARYADAVPDDFRFLVKACSWITSPWKRDSNGDDSESLQYLDAGFATDEVVAPFVEGLGPKAGVLVFQFTPQGARAGDAPKFAAALGAFLDALPKGPRYAVELRDSALLTADYADALRAADAVHCVSLHPRMPPLQRQLDVAGREDGPLVVRWMLRAGLGYEAARQRYMPFKGIVDADPGRRSAIAGACLSHPRSQPVTVIVNNKAEGCAPQSVFELARAMATR